MPAETITAGWPTLVELEDVIASMKQGTSDLAALAEERYLPLFDTFGKEPDPLPRRETLAHTAMFVAWVEQELDLCRRLLLDIAKARDEGALGLRRHEWPEETDDAR